MTAKQLKNSILKEAFEGKLITNNIRFDNGLPQGWQIKTIGEVCEINPKNKLDDNLEVSFIPMNLILDKFQNKFSYEIKNWKDIKKEYTHLKNNCIALAKITPCFENGKCTILRNLKNGYGAGTTELIILLPNTKKVIIEYVFYFINTQYFIEQGKRNFRGTAGQLRISTDFVSNFSIPLPPIEEQKRIVNKLNELMPLIEEYEKLETELNELDKKFPERLKKSILKDAVQGKLVSQNNKDEPSSELLKRIKSERDKLIKAGKIKPNKNISSIYRKGNSFYEKRGKDEICIDAELPFEIPKTWELVRLKELCRLIDGEYREEELIILDAKFLRGKSEGIKSNSGKYVSAGDYLILVDGENSGEVFKAPINGYLGSTFKILWIAPFININYILYFIELYKLPLKNSKKGVAIPHLNRDLFFNLLLPIPPIEEQKRIVEKLDKLMELCEELKTE